METEIYTESSKTVFCSRYEEMLTECQNALAAWSTRREEAWRMGLRGKELGGELVRLQADFAKSYARLQKHTRECALCDFVGKMCNESQTPYVVAPSQYGPA
jgi:hypothetical protein